MIKEPRILLIEDNQGDAELTREVFKNHAANTQMHVLNNGEEALQSLKQKGEFENELRPHLILLDINLPKVDGKEVLRFIKNDDELKCIPVVIFSTSSLEEDINYAYRHHANCYMVKPANLKDFNLTIKAIYNFWINSVTYPNKN